MEDNEIKTGLLFLIKTIDMARFRRSGMQWGVSMGETESKQKKRKERETEGQKRDKLNRNDGEREKETESREGVFSLASITFLRRSFLHGMPAIPTNQRPIKILK